MGKKDLNFTWKQEVSDDLSMGVLKLLPEVSTLQSLVAIILVKLEI